MDPGDLGPTPSYPAPLLARWLAPAGPPAVRLVRRGGAAVLAVPGRYSVSYLLLTAEAVAVVDVGSAADVPRILAALEWLGRAPAEVRHVVPTHLHFDHVMGIDVLARHLRAPVTLGRTAFEHVLRGSRLRFPPGARSWHAVATWPLQGLPFFPAADWLGGMGFGFPWSRNRFTAALGPALEPGGDIPDLPGWTVLATPGHSDDAVCLHHPEAGLLVAGDTVRNFHGGEWNPLLVDEVAFAETRRALLAQRVEFVFPGHGPVLEGPDVLTRLRTLPRGIP